MEFGCLKNLIQGKDEQYHNILVMSLYIGNETDSICLFLVQRVR